MTPPYGVPYGMAAPCGMHAPFGMPMHPGGPMDGNLTAALALLGRKVILMLLSLADLTAWDMFLAVSACSLRHLRGAART